MWSPAYLVHAVSVAVPWVRQGALEGERHDGTEGPCDHNTQQNTTPHHRSFIRHHTLEEIRERHLGHGDGRDEHDLRGIFVLGLSVSTHAKKNMRGLS